MKITYTFTILVFAVAQLYAQQYEWAIQAGGTGAEKGNSIAVDNSGNVYVTGTFAGTVDFDPSSGVAEITGIGLDDIFVAKYDADGNYLWAFNIGSTSFDYGNDITVDGDGNFYITGMFSGIADFDPLGGTSTELTPTSEDIYYAKYTGDGVLSWAYNIGGSAGDRGLAIAVDASSHVYLTGYFRSICDFDPGTGAASLTALDGGPDIFYSKYSSSGAYLWANSVGSTEGDAGNDITVSNTGDVYLTGYFQETADFDPSADSINTLIAVGGLDIYLAKYNSSGEFTWAFNIGAGGSDEGFSIKTDDAGDVYAGGYFTGSADFDPSASTVTLSSGTAEDGFITKYDTDGNYLAAFDIGAGSSDLVNDIAVTGAGDIYVSGSFMGIVDFDPSAEVAELTAEGETDIFFASFATDISFISASSAGGPESESAYGIATDGFANSYVTGDFMSTADFDPSAEIAELTEFGAGDIFVAKYSELPIGINEAFAEQVIQVYPIPAQGYITCELPAETKSIIIHDVSGIVLFRTIDVAGSLLQIDISGFSAGIYILRLTDSDDRMSKAKIGVVN